MKALFLLFVIFLCSFPLHAEDVSVLTELEQAQEKLWYLQRDVGRAKISIEEQQKKIKALDSGLHKDLQQLSGRLTSLDNATAVRVEKLHQIEDDLKDMGEALHVLSAEVRQQDSTIQSQAEKIQTLENAFAATREEREAQRSGTGVELSHVREQVTEVRTQTGEIRSQLTTLESSVGGQIRQLAYWGAGVAMFFAIALTFVVLLIKNRK